MRSSFTAEAKVGIFVLIGIFVLSYMSIKVSDFRLNDKEGYLVTVDFTNSGGLKKEAAVRVAGVSVGKVRSISLKGSRARVILYISEGIVLEKDVKASIKTAGVLGDKYVDIIPGKSEKHLSDGDEIVSTLSPADLDSLLNNLTEISHDIKAITTSLKDSIASQESTENIKAILANVSEATMLLKQVVEKNESKVDALFTNLESVSQNIDALVKGNDRKIDNFFTNFEDFSASLTELIENNNNKISQAVENLQWFTEDLRDISEENKKPLKEMVANLKDFSQNLADKTPVITEQLEIISTNLKGILDENRENVKVGIENISVASENLKEALDSIKVVTSRIEESQGTLGKLISEDTTYNKVNETLTGINKFLNKAEEFKTIVDYRFEYMDDSSEFKNYLSVKLQPSEDKYYFIELVDDPAGVTTDTDTLTTIQVGDDPAETTYTEEVVHRDRLKFSIGIAKRYYDLVLRGGIIESSGGLGVDYYMLDDRFRLSFEAFDFNNDDNPHLKATARMRFMKHLFVTGGYDDFIKNDKDGVYFVGAGFTFVDDDLKYILSSVPTP